MGYKPPNEPPSILPDKYYKCLIRIWSSRDCTTGLYYVMQVCQLGADIPGSIGTCIDHIINSTMLQILSGPYETAEECSTA